MTGYRVWSNGGFGSVILFAERDEAQAVAGQMAEDHIGIPVQVIEVSDIYFREAAGCYVARPTAKETVVSELVYGPD